MTVRTRSLAVLASLTAVAAPVALATAVDASASGKPVNCTLNSTTTYPGITTSKKLPVLNAGTVVLKRDVVNDGLILAKATPKAGWTKSIEIKTGPKVVAKFENGTVKVELEAAQSAVYYGPDVLVVEIKTCTLA